MKIEFIYESIAQKPLKRKTPNDQRCFMLVFGMLPSLVTNIYIYTYSYPHTHAYTCIYIYTYRCACLFVGYRKSLLSINVKVPTKTIRIIYQKSRSESEQEMLPPWRRIKHCSAPPHLDASVEADIAISSRIVCCAWDRWSRSVIWSAHSRRRD